MRKVIRKLNPFLRGYVHAARTSPDDDNWGKTTATIELAPHLPADSLRGLDMFSHVEVLYVFDRVPVEKIVTDARHPRNNPAWPKVGIFAQRAKNRPNRGPAASLLFVSNSKGASGSGSRKGRASSRWGAEPGAWPIGSPGA